MTEKEKREQVLFLEDISRSTFFSVRFRVSSQYDEDMSTAT